MLVATFMLHLQLVRTALSFFVCEDVGGDSFFSKDTRIECDSEVHVMWKYGLGLPMFVIYGLGIPLSKGLLLKRLSKDGMLEGKKEVYGFAYVSYTPQCYYWENMIVARKVGAAACGVLLIGAGTDLQAYGVLFVVFAALL